ncbi:MAG: glycoside hydrolase family 2 [Akkermansiaceae bacterium]|nr:glycoside hydrolase family 2 [Akkermansiaceae bacterium]
MFRLSFLILNLVFLTVFAPAQQPVASEPADSADWQMKRAPLMTPFAADVKPDNVLPEYPRPQLVREKWLNLNGIWAFKDSASSGPPQEWPEKILVPFPIQSALSGVMKQVERAWYRRTFTVPADWEGQHIILHFGAVDWESEIFINGNSIGTHRGGYDPFSYDITDALKGPGPQELAVRIFDPTENGGQPRGKQAIKGIPIMYTPTSGIWQTVWLEPVPTASIQDLRILPDIDKGTVSVKVNVKNPPAGSTVALQVSAAEKMVTTISGEANREIVIPLPKAVLWSPDQPFLYDLKVILQQDAKPLDTVASYFGMRKISLKTIDGIPKILLNNKFVFQLGALDQGFWPDGLYTAPTDAALKFDLELQKKLGFNMVRKHVKVEPLRWYYWADKMGLLVWQDMPTAQSYGGVDADPDLYVTELTRMIETHWNSPCIVMWVVYNENCGQNAHIKQGLSTAKVAGLAKKLDPNRLVNEASGYDWYGAGDVADSHTYPAPDALPGAPGQAIVSGEFGAIKYPLKDHQWAQADDVNVTTSEEYLSRYASYLTKLCQLKTEKGMSGAVYTQITDVETEQNGIFTYDRKAPKADIAALAKLNLRAIHQRYEMVDILPTSRKSAQKWEYTTADPGEKWFAMDFNDRDWQTGRAPFASEGTPNVKVGTSWKTDDIWIRKEFRIGSLSPDDLDNLYLDICHDDDCEVYLNGVKVGALNAASTYAPMALDKAGKKALKQNAANLIAVHCHQTGGDQAIDVGLEVLRFVDDTK